MKPPITMTPKPVKVIPFLRNMKQVPYSHVANVVIAFEHDPELKDTVWYDEFLDRLQTATPARTWLDDDDTRIAAYLQRRHGFNGIGSRQIREVVNYCGRQHPKHCVRDWLSTLTWDGEARIADAFIDHWDAQPTQDQPREYLQAVSRNFFIGLIARVMKPGCQLDEMVVFESAQGSFKTSALRILGGPWYAATHEKVTSKDFFQDLQGKWIIEISELSAFSHAQVERIKHVISTPTDYFRGSYDHRSSDHPRQCVFCGTTNRDDWGHDETGLRRFWPIRCGPVERVALAASREQLFAEAVHRYAAGEPWWEVPDCTATVQAQRQDSDPWTDLIVPWLEEWRRKSVVVGFGDGLKLSEILTGPLRLSPDKIDKAAEVRVAKILRLLGWEKQRIRNFTDRAVFWLPSGE
jgi:putative DNA primase/helicase